MGLLPGEGPPNGLGEPPIRPLDAPLVEKPLVTSQSAIQIVAKQFGAPDGWEPNDEDMQNMEEIFRNGKAGSLPKDHENYPMYQALVDAGYKVPEDPSEGEIPDWLRIIDDAAADRLAPPAQADRRSDSNLHPQSGVRFPSAPTSVAPDRRVVLRRAARTALGRGVDIMHGAYARTSGFLDALGRRVKSLSFEENGATSESVRGDPITIESQSLQDSTYTRELYNKLKANRDAVTGVEDVPGYLDHMVRETHEEVTTLDKKRQELEASKEKSKGAITVLHKGSEIAGQSESVTFDIAVGQATDVEKNAWLTAKNAEITAGNTQIGRLKRKTPLLTEIPAEVTTLRVTRSQAKKRSEDEYAFDPTQAESVMNAREKLDNAIEHEREAYEEYVDFINKSIATTEQQSFEALFDIMSELRVSCSDNPDVVNKILSDPSVATLEVKLRVVDLAKKIKSGLTFADKKQGVNLDTPEGIFDYLKKRMADSRLQTYETERISVSASASVQEKAEEEHRKSLHDAERWRVDEQGKPTGNGHKELAQVNARENTLLATLGDTAIVDLYLRTGYLPSEFETKKGGEYATVVSEQEKIAGLESERTKHEQAINELSTKNDPDYVEVIGKKKLKLGECQAQIDASLVVIQNIMDPSVRLQEAGDFIQGINSRTLSQELNGLGLTIASDADLNSHLNRVGQAFTQALEGMKAKGEVPTELKLFGEVIAILRGEQPPEIVASQPAPEPPPQPGVQPGAPPVPGAAPRLEPETNPVGGETAEQLADRQASTALDALDPTKPADRLMIIAGARDLVGELSKPGSEGTLQLAWEISNLPDEQRGKTLAEVRSRVEKHPALKPLVRLFDLLDQLKMNYRDLVSLGKVKQKSLEGPAAAAVGLMLLLQSLSKIDAEAAGATNQQPEH